MGAWLLLCAGGKRAPAAEPSDRLAWKKPVVYCGGGMVLWYGFFLSIGVWEDDPSYASVEEAFRRAPEWDPNPFYYNWLLHPLWGSETYLRAREGRFGIIGSFLFSTACSFAWEYVIESWVVHPGAQDLLSTSPLGSVLGEARYRLKRRMNPAHDWWLDPIDTALKHVSLAVMPGPGGRTETVMTMQWAF